MELLLVTRGTSVAGPSEANYVPNGAKSSTKFALVRKGCSNCERI